MGKRDARVAIIGAGFPAQIVGKALAKHVDVDIFGDPGKALVTTSFGPHHLWAERLVDAGASAAKAWPRVFKCDLATVSVCHLVRGTPVELTPDDALANEAYEGYWKKVNGEPRGEPPCRGRRRFTVFCDGFDALAADLDSSKADVRNYQVTSLHEHRGGFYVTHGGEIGPDGPYDALVNTLRPDQFAMLASARGQPLWYGPPPFPRKVHYAIGSRPPAADFEDVDTSHGKTQVLVYNGSPQDLWHRCSTTKDGWCYEFNERPPAAYLRGIGSECSTEIPTRVNECLTPFHYGGKIVPVGRFAEWNSELMVDDVMLDVSRYVKEVLDVL
jgi:hypothetical protein